MVYGHEDEDEPKRGLELRLPLLRVSFEQIAKILKKIKNLFLLGGKS